MSGFTNITGFAPPTTIAGFMGLLQTASFRGVPFKVVSARVKKGRRWAIHEYPFVDGGWPEDMGRALRTYSFSGYLIGDLAPVMQLLLDNAVETEGPGLLIHPTIGAIRVGVVSSATAIHRDHMRVIEVAFEFVEAGGGIFPLTIIATIISVFAAASSALTASGSNLGMVAGPVAAAGPAVTGEGQAVVTSFAAAVALGGGNPTAIVGMAAALPPPDANTTYGRYGAGSASAMLPDGTTVATLQAQLANQRAALAAAARTAGAAAGSYSVGTDMTGALASLLEAMRAGISDPANQVSVLLTLSGFTFQDGAGGVVGIGAAMATMRDAMAAACRRAALVSLARASAAYQPKSYNDAAALRVVLSAALDSEATAAGDSGEDVAYGALKTLRAAVVRDLTVRGASLPSVVTVVFRQSMPALAIAQQLYRDGSRSDEIVAAAAPVHPAFCPISFQTLTLGMAATVNPTIPDIVSRGTGVLVRKGSLVGAYIAPQPAAPIGLTVGGMTGLTAALSWSAAPIGAVPVAYLIQASLHGTGIWFAAGSVVAPATSGTAIGLTSNTAYDFQVLGTNPAGNGPASALAIGTTTAAAPNAATGLAGAAGSPSSSVVALTWTASAMDGTHDAAASYTPQYGLSGSGIWASFGSPIAGTSVNVSGLGFATAYDFRVIATNTGGTATSSTATVTTITAAPNAATGLTTSAGSPAYSVVGLSWTAAAVDGSHGAVTVYAVSYGTDGVTWTPASGAWTSGTAATVIGLAHATAYYFKVAASNAGGTGGSVVTGSTRTTDIAPPNAPAIATVPPAYDGTTTKLTVAWSASTTDGTHDAATGYDAQWSVHAASTWTLVSSISSGAVITGLAAGTSYDVQVRGKNASSSSPGAWSASTTASPYSSTVVWGINPPPSTYVHSGGPPINANFSVNPPAVNFAWSPSNTVIPTTALYAATYAGSYYNWAGYPGTPVTPGTSYLLGDIVERDRHAGLRRGRDHVRRLMRSGWHPLR